MLRVANKLMMMMMMMMMFYGQVPEIKRFDLI